MIRGGRTLWQRIRFVLRALAAILEAAANCGLFRWFAGVSRGQFR